MKAVQHNSGLDLMIGLSFGLTGGFTKYLLQVQVPYPQKLVEAAITALVCGACGVIGKELVVLAKKKWFKK